jgi:F-type H+-transporting ATPase subunit delta
MKSVRVARRYAMALMNAVKDRRDLEGTAKDLHAVSEFLGASRPLRLFLASPVISSEKKLDIAKKIFGPHISAQTLSFITLLIAKHRESLLAAAIEEFGVLYDRRLGIMNVDVTSSVEVTPPQQKELKTQLEQFTRKNVRLRFAVDQSIKGGLVVKVGDTVVDASLARQLQLLRERFVRGSAPTP